MYKMVQMHLTVLGLLVKSSSGTNANAEIEKILAKKIVYGASITTSLVESLLMVPKTIANGVL